MLALVHGKGKRVERAKAKGGKCSPTLELERMGTEQRKRTDTCRIRSSPGSPGSKATPDPDKRDRGWWAERRVESELRVKRGRRSDRASAASQHLSAACVIL